MPSVKKGESKESYLNRCIPIVISEGKSQEQAVAQCSGMYDEAKEDMSEEVKWFGL